MVFFPKGGLRCPHMGPMGPIQIIFPRTHRFAGGGRVSSKLKLDGIAMPYSPRASKTLRFKLAPARGSGTGNAPRSAEDPAREAKRSAQCGAGRGGCPQCGQRAAPSAIAGSGQPPRPALCRAAGSPLGQRGQRADPPPSGAPAGVDQPARAARPDPCPTCVRCCARAKAARGMRRVRREATRWAKCGRWSCSCRSTSAAQCRSPACAAALAQKRHGVVLCAAFVARPRAGPSGAAAAGARLQLSVAALQQRCGAARAPQGCACQIVAAGTAVQERNENYDKRASESCGQREQEVRSRGGSEHQARTVAAAPRQSKAVPSRRSARPASRSRAHALRISFRLLSRASICTGAQQH